MGARDHALSLIQFLVSIVFIYWNMCHSFIGCRLQGVILLPPRQRLLQTNFPLSGTGLPRLQHSLRYSGYLLHLEALSLSL